MNLRVVDVDMERRKLFIQGENSRWVAASGEFLELLGEAVNVVLTGPLFENARSSRWKRTSISDQFRRQARAVGLPENVQFPGTAKLRAPLVKFYQSADAATDGAAPNSGPVFSPYLPPKKWIPRFDCSPRAWPGIKRRHRGEDHPILKAKSVRFPLEELGKVGIVPPGNGAAQNTHIAHIPQKLAARTG